MKRCPLCQTEYPDTFKICPQDGGKLDEPTVIIETPTTPLGTSAIDPMIGRTIAGRFRIERKLGEGGMGAVYKAEHVKMGRPCAIKILNATALNDPEALPRFTREAQMSSRIDHPNAVTIYDYGESEDGLVYLAMEYVEGETLTKVLEREGRFTIDRALKIARQIGAALDAAHALSIVHRDLKPDNIMLTRKGSDPDIVKVLDFGIAKMAEDKEKRFDLTQAGLIIGTPYYMSPEQVGGEKLDPRSDVYSFALIVYEMLTGGLPFHGQNTQAVMVSRLTTSPRPLRTINPDIPMPVEAAVMHALERDRDMRTPSAGQFVANLEDAVAGRGPDLGPGQTKLTTNPQPRPDTAAMRANPSTPPAVESPTVPIQAVGPVTPQGQPPIYPTDRAPHPAGYGSTAVEPQPFASPPPYPIGAPPPPAYPVTAQAPAQKKGGKAGIIFGVLLVLLLLGGAAGVAGFGYYKGWFTSAPPKEPPTNGGPDTTADADKLFQEGYELQVREDNAGAIAKYRAAIAKKSNFPKAHRNLGAALVNTGQYEEAIKELEIAMQQAGAPDDQIYFNLGLANFKLKNYAKAGESFKKAGQLGTDASAHAYAGFAFDNAGNDTAADEEYNKYLQVQPDGQFSEIVKGILAGKADVPTADDFQR